MLLPGVGAGDLPEEESGVLGLEDDEFIKPRIGFGRCWHGRRIGIPQRIYKREETVEIDDDISETRDEGAKLKNVRIVVASSFALQGRASPLVSKFTDVRCVSAAQKTT